jgi:hypothetical protein
VTGQDNASESETEGKSQSDGGKAKSKAKKQLMPRSALEQQFDLELHLMMSYMRRLEEGGEPGES